MSGVLKYTLIVRHPELSTPTALLQGQPVPDWASDLVHADDLEGGDSEAGVGGGSRTPTKAEMLAEIESRNTGRADEDRIVPVSEKNADLAAALEADDQAAAAKQ